MDWIASVMEQYGYLGILLLIALENLFPPIPSEVILPFAGFLVTSGSLAFWGVVAFATLGSLIGALILYTLGRVLHVERIYAIVERYGKWLQLRVSDVQRAERWFDKYGGWTVLLCRMVPIIRSLISIPAGMARMSLVPFLFFTTIGTLLWNLLLVGVGALLGQAYYLVEEWVGLYQTLVLILLAAVAILAVVWWVRRMRASQE